MSRSFLSIHIKIIDHKHKTSKQMNRYSVEGLMYSISNKRLLFKYIQMTNFQREKEKFLPGKNCED